MAKSIKSVKNAVTIDNTTNAIVTDAPIVQPVPTIEPVTPHNFLSVNVDGISIDVDTTFYTTENSQYAAAAAQIAVGGDSFSAYVRHELNATNHENINAYAIATLEESRYKKALLLGFATFAEAMESTIADTDLPVKKNGKKMTQAEFKASLRSLKVGGNDAEPRLNKLKTEASRAKFGFKFDGKANKFTFEPKQEKVPTCDVENLFKNLEKFNTEQMAKLALLINKSVEENTNFLANEIVRIHAASTAQNATVQVKQAEQKLVAFKKITLEELKTVNNEISRAITSKDAALEKAAKKAGVTIEKARKESIEMFKTFDDAKKAGKVGSLSPEFMAKVEALNVDAYENMYENLLAQLAS